MLIQAWAGAGAPELPAAVSPLITTVERSGQATQRAFAASRRRTYRLRHHGIDAVDAAFPAERLVCEGYGVVVVSDPADQLERALFNPLLSGAVCTLVFAIGGLDSTPISRGIRVGSTETVVVDADDVMFDALVSRTAVERCGGDR